MPGKSPAPRIKDVTRFEVIDEKGRALVKYAVDVELSYQDDGRTLKVFIKHNPDKVKTFESSQLFSQTDITELLARMTIRKPIVETKPNV